MDPFNALSTAAVARLIPPLREALPAKVVSCALVTSTDLGKALDAMKEVIGGASVPSVMMGSRPAKSAGQLATVGGRLTPSRWVSHHLCARIPLLPRAVVCVPSSDDRERALFGLAHASFYGCPHPEEDNHSVPASGSVEQQ
jgi:hypothetical protein